MIQACEDILYRSFIEGSLKGSPISGAAIDVFSAASKGSIEKRALKEILCSYFTLKELQTLIGNLDRRNIEKECEI